MITHQEYIKWKNEVQSAIEELRKNLNKEGYRTLLKYKESELEFLEKKFKEQQNLKD